MQSVDLLHIRLDQAANAAAPMLYKLDDSFFADLEQEEISGGLIDAEVRVKASAGDIYTIHIALKGNVTVACDRCLEPLTLDVDTEDIIKVKDGMAEDCDDPEMLYCHTADTSFDLSWQVYEIIETSLPLLRYHPEGECNEEMLDYITGETSGESEES